MQVTEFRPIVCERKGKKDAAERIQGEIDIYIIFSQTKKKEKEKRIALNLTKE